MVCIYLAEDVDGRMDQAGIDGFEGDPERCELDKYRPYWVAYAAHDHQGDDLRRRWDDPELEKIGLHPVVYAGAGSHASYYMPGEYLTELELPALTPLVKITHRLQEYWHRQLRQYQDEPKENGLEPSPNIFRIPFVDYARGDGLAIGPGHAKEWNEPHLLTDDDGWVAGYRGLWGLYARDPFAGENAPAGPMYNRDRSVRRAWYDPVGWAGLDKVPPPGQELPVLLTQQRELHEQQAALQEAVEAKSRELWALGTAMASMRSQPHLHKMYLEYQKRVDELSVEVGELRSQIANTEALLEALALHGEQLQMGMRGPARAHIRHARVPTPDEEYKAGRLAEIWAAASIGLILVGFFALIYFARDYTVYGLVAIVALFTFIEASFRGRVVKLVTSVTVGLAVVATLVLIYKFFWSIVAIGVLLIGGYLLWENLRELWQ